MSADPFPPPAPTPLERIDVYTNALPDQWRQPKTVRAVHLPTGITAEHTDVSELHARTQALLTLRERVLAAAPDRGEETVRDAPGGGPGPLAAEPFGPEPQPGSLPENDA